MTRSSFRLKPNRASVAVVDIGGTSIKIGFSVEARPHAFTSIHPTETLRDGDPVGALALMIDAALVKSGITPGFVVATVPGFIDKDWDHVLSAANVPTLNGRALATDLSSALGCPVFLERDSVLLLAGEAFAGAGQGIEHILGLFFGTGIGAAYLQGGVPFRGAGWAFELGLMPFRGDGRRLAGMRTDCLEAYCSGRVLQGIAARHGVEVAATFKAAKASPVLAADVTEFVRYQAFAIGCAVAIASPEAIVLGGGILDMAGFPKKLLSRLVEQHAPIAETGRRLDLRWSQLGWTSVLHGAPFVVAERLAASRAARRQPRRRKNTIEGHQPGSPARIAAAQSGRL